MSKTPKVFYTYERQIEHLKKKKLIIHDENRAIELLQRYSYYSCISAYKGIFKSSSNGDYLPGTTFDNIVALYLLDRGLRDVFLNYILIVENHIKSLYSYAFCEMFGDRQDDYCNANNYNYAQFSDPVDKFFSLLRDHLSNPPRDYIKYNLNTYGEVPLWVLIHALTLGNISKMYEFSKQSLQSEVAKGFRNSDIFPHHLISMLKVLSKFRNTCAHSERLYSYRTKETIRDMPIHAALGIGHSGHMYRYGKKDLFSVVICLKYLLSKDDFRTFFVLLDNVIRIAEKSFSPEIFERIRKAMGFPTNWRDIQMKEDLPVKQ